MCCLGPLSLWSGVQQPRDPPPGGQMGQGSRVRGSVFCLSCVLKRASATREGTSQPSAHQLAFQGPRGGKGLGVSPGEHGQVGGHEGQAGRWGRPHRPDPSPLPRLGGRAQGLSDFLSF